MGSSIVWVADLAQACRGDILGARCADGGARAHDRRRECLRRRGRMMAEMLVLLRDYEHHLACLKAIAAVTMRSTAATNSQMLWTCPAKHIYARRRRKEIQQRVWWRRRS